MHLVIDLHELVKGVHIVREFGVQPDVFPVKQDREGVKHVVLAPEVIIESTLRYTGTADNVIDGRIAEAPEYSTTASYTVTISKGGEVVDTLTLATYVPGIYEK